jgi:hypothetical protein
MLFREIEKEVQAGLPNSSKRLCDARMNLCYYKGNFEEYEGDVIPYNRKTDDRSDRFSLCFNKIVNTLTAHLYKNPPARTVENNPEATKFLQQVYKDNAMFALWHEADRLSMVTDVCAFQVGTTNDIKHPIRISLWDASQFTVFVDPDDPTKPYAVVTIDCYDNQRRLTVWTKETKTVYLTPKWNHQDTSGKTEGRRIYHDVNTLGRLPFVFVHFNFPTTDFWSGGPGDQLRIANRYINFRLVTSADDIRYLGNPMMVAEGVGPEWTPPKRTLPGDVIVLPKGEVSGGMNNDLKPNLRLLEPDTQFVNASWEDIQNYLDHTLETNNIPEAAVRFTASAGRSGMSIQAEQMPLIQWARGRQPQFAHYESCLAQLVFEVSASQLSPSKMYEDALKDFELSVRWSEIYHDVPGPERDRADDWLLAHGMTSKTQILMKRTNMTRAEVLAELESVARDLKEEAEIDHLTDAEPVQNQDQNQNQEQVKEGS